MWEGWEEVWEEVWRSCAIALRIKLSTARHVDACVGRTLVRDDNSNPERESSNVTRNR